MSPIQKCNKLAHTTSRSKVMIIFLSNGILVEICSLFYFGMRVLLKNTFPHILRFSILTASKNKFPHIFAFSIHIIYPHIFALFYPHFISQNLLDNSPEKTLVLQKSQLSDKKVVWRNITKINLSGHFILLYFEGVPR